jgi:4-amino-4-deoxychorismate lyase
MILVNGAAADSVAATDRGLAYGDGVFRTLLTRRGQPLAWARQYRKLERDCAALALSCPSQEALAGDLASAVDAASDQVVKIIVTRGSGTRGYAPPEPCAPTRIVMTGPLPDYPEEYGREGVEVRVCRTRLAFQPRLAGVKHLNRLENVLARAEWSDAAIPEGLLMDEDGNIVGGTMSNLFLVESGILVTPELARCGVAGVTRERVIEAAAGEGVACREERISPERVMSAEEALLVNSVIGVWCIRVCGRRRWHPGSWTKRVREWLDEAGD